jgi:hypothetical protein
VISTYIDAALEEKSAILSAREKGFSVQKSYGKVFKEPARVSVQANIGGSSSRKQTLRRSVRGPGFIARVESEGLMHPGRGINAKDSASDNRGAIRRESTSVGTRDTGKRIGCYACGKFGHVATVCRMADGSGGGELVRETDRGFTAAAPLDPGSNDGPYRASDRSTEFGHVASEGEIQIFY